ncbi:MAG: T9SS C-terminal target domain-containing protein [Bacteroidetes bacterium]|nr:MAG: T9SS C-terminal target domain-containing protein [Bacteroidota bacterium]
MYLRPLLFLLWLGLTSLSSLIAQDTRCGTMDYLHQQELADPDLPQRMAAIERFTQEYQQSQAGRDNDVTVITIPVVVHVVYNTAVENISEAQVISQIDILNEDFRRLNADTTASSQWAQAADFQMEFCLAKIDPDGFPTNGITRTPTNVSSFNTNNGVKFDAQGGKDAWPSDTYLNIWVCDLGNGLLGYAQFPGGNPATDGVVINYQYFGRVGTASPPFHLGRTATHEVGHWLNLRHIWGDGGCGVDDGVADTPLSDGPNYGCNPGHVSCGSVDMVENYMDYGDDICLTAFTAGQRERSMALFAPGGARESILSANVCCPATSCPRLGSLDLSSPDDSTILLSWAAVDSQPSYQIRYRPLGDSLWTEGLSTTNTSFTLDELRICTTYEIQVATACQADTNTYCATYQMRTRGCCEPPAQTQLLASAATIAQINWRSVYGAHAYEVRYRLLTDTTWNYFSTADTTLILLDLETCAGYAFQVKSLCDTLTQDYSPETIFYTKGCESCTDLTYCTPTGSGNLMWIDKIQIGGLNWTSGTDLGYGDRGNFSTPLYLDSLQQLVLRRGGSFSAPHSWAIWLDINRDGVFHDSTERIYDSGEVSGDSLMGQLFLPDSLPSGRTRLRIGAQITAFSGGNTLTACGTVVQGEYEDYCVDLRYICKAPASMTVAYDSLNASYEVAWAGYAFSNDYLLQYREENDTVWTEVPLVDTAYSIPAADLQPCARYLFGVRSQCFPEQSIFTTTDTVLTRCTTSLDPLLAREINLYPNPTQGTWTVKAPLDISAVVVYDLMGRQVFSQRGNRSELIIQSGRLPAGMYLVEIHTDRGRTLKRLQYAGQ